MKMLILSQTLFEHEGHDAGIHQCVLIMNTRRFSVVGVGITNTWAAASVQFLPGAYMVTRVSENTFSQNFMWIISRISF